MAKVAASIAIVVALLVLVPAALADANFIAQVCKKTNHDECVEVFNSDPRSVNATTRVELNSIALDICTAACGEGEQRTGDEKARHPDDEPLNQALDFCLSAYKQGIHKLADARTEFGNGAYHNAATKIGEAASAVEDCESGFSEHGVKSVMSDANNKTSDRCDMAWQLIAWWKWNSGKPKRQ